ncbi:MAG TPA: 30S ribosomal protein S9 [Candidatus Paceibacterota bacterium]|nr:30S ribosomal protein S9 [Candidatus Paceibacterota bacterium]
MATKKTDKKYVGAIGRRKTAVASVRVFEDKGGVVTINDRDMQSYFPLPILQAIVKDPFEKANFQNTFSVSAIVKGGGSRAQAEAIRHGIARALVAIDPELRRTIKKAGYLKRDPRMKERKKFGLKGARRAPQWSKR